MGILDFLRGRKTQSVSTPPKPTVSTPVVKTPVPSQEPQSEDHGVVLHNVKRSSTWGAFKNKFLKDHPACEACGKTDAVQVHHVFPFDYAINLGFPSLEEWAPNLITLCETESGKPEENHHLALGHLMNFKCANLNVRQDVITYRGQTLEQIQESSNYQREEKDRLPAFEDLTEQEKTDAIAWIKAHYPDLPEFQKTGS